MRLQLASLRRALAAVVSCSLLSLAVAACEEDIKASDYDQSCNADSECVPIETGAGSCCGFSDCGDDAAINKADFRQYLSDFQAASSATCGGAHFECPNIECQPPPAVCVKHVCQLARVLDGQ